MLDWNLWVNNHHSQIEGTACMNYSMCANKFQDYHSVICQMVSRKIKQRLVVSLLYDCLCYTRAQAFPLMSLSFRALLLHECATTKSMIDATCTHLGGVCV